MFRLLTVEDIVRIPPKSFGHPIDKAAKEQISTVNPCFVTAVTARLRLPVPALLTFIVMSTPRCWTFEWFDDDVVDVRAALESGV